MNIGNRATEGDVLASFGESEVDSLRWRRVLEAQFGRDTVTRLRETPTTEWTPGDREAASAMSRMLRAPMLAGLLPLGVSWYVGDLPVSEVPRLRIAAYEPFHSLTPDWSLAKFVDSFDAGKFPPDPEFVDGFRRLRRDWDSSKVRGRPVLVSDVAMGSYTILEGTTRLAAILSRSRGGLSAPDSIPVYVGLTARISEWNFRGGP